MRRKREKPARAEGPSYRGRDEHRSGVGRRGGRKVRTSTSKIAKQTKTWIGAVHDAC